MDEMKKQLPPVELYRITPEQVDRLSPLMTPEAADMLREGEAAGLAILDEGVICGTICGALDPENEQVLQLVSLFVAPDYRRRGLGSTLLSEFVEAILDAFDYTVRWVEMDFSPNTELESLLAGCGFRMETETEHSRLVTVAQLAQSPLASRDVSVPEDCRLLHLDRLPDYQLLAVLRSRNADYIDGKDLEKAQNDISYIMVDEEGELVSCAIFAETGPKRLCLLEYFTADHSPRDALVTLDASLDAIRSHYSPDTVLEIPILFPSVTRLAERLLDNAGEDRPLIHAILDC